MAYGDVELLEQMRADGAAGEKMISTASIVALVSGRSPDRGHHTVSTSIPSSRIYAPLSGGIVP
jgi:hypothetical protein